MNLASVRESRIRNQYPDVVVERLRAWLRSSRDVASFISVPEIGAFLATDRGTVRRENQDRVYIARFSSGGGLPPLTVAILCDGMGGMVQGAECAEIAATEAILSILLARRPLSEELVSQAVLNANRAVFQRFAGAGGTTLVLLANDGRGVIGASVGDSRLYYWSGKLLRQISYDDTIAGELARIRKTRLQPDEQDATSRRLAQFIGMADDVVPRLYFFPSFHNEEASFLLTSDGAHSIDERTFEGILRGANDPELAIRRIVSVSKWLGGHDNASLLLFHPQSYETRMSLFPESPLLEVWTSNGKFELAFSEMLPPSLVRPEAVKPHEGLRKNKRSSSSPKPKSSKSKSSNEPQDSNSEVPQRKLEILITDADEDKPKETN